MPFEAYDDNDDDDDDDDDAVPKQLKYLSSNYKKYAKPVWT